MSDLKISALPRKSALAINDLIPIVDLQFGAPNYVNKKTTIGDLVTIVSAAVADLSGAISSVNGLTGAVVINVANLGDTTITSPDQGDILRYDAATGKWVNIPFIVDGKIPADYLPSYVDDVVEYDNFASFPDTGESGKIYVALDTKYIYRWSGSLYVEIGNADHDVEWDAIQNIPQSVLDVAAIPDFAEYIAGAGVVSEDFSVLGVSQGAYASGNVVPAGTPLETVIKNMLQVLVPATYTQPTLSISTSNAVVYEYGAPVSITLNLSWAKNDAGDATQFTYKLGSTLLTTVSASSPASYAYSAASLASTLVFTGTATYAAGAIKTDNFGDPSPVGAIPAGTKTTSNSISVVPRHKRYWGLSANPDITDAEILQLNSELATARAQTRNDFNPAAEYIYIVYPASFGAATIKFNGYIATSSWQLTIRNFVNANGYTESYRIYRTQYTQNSPDIDIEVL